MVGETISHYKIIKKIGQGGMGEVFLAQDTKLDRKVALKFLPEELQQDSTARKRFLREAKSAAALDHPYICHIHEVGEVEGQSFISMEYIQGQTLRDKLAGGPLPTKTALQTAVEIAEALEAAHQQSIVHRDLKPSNIMLTPGGHVKVMDFGLAKQLSPIEGETEEITTALTREGSNLGTLPYMSPEQVRGQVVDTRSDIFSFGVVLYEMLTGVNPLKRDSAMDTASAILTETPPPLSRYTEEIPVLLQHTVKKMLAKEPARRYQLIHDVMTNLGELIEESGDMVRAVAPKTGHTERSGLRLTLPWVVAALLAFAAGLLWMSRSGETPARVVRTAIPLPQGQHVTGLERSYPLAISRDGRQLAYVAREAGTTRLSLRHFDESDVRPISETDGARYPFFSPDGEWIGYWANGTLYRVRVAGGPPLPVCDAPGLDFGAAWGPDGSIVFASSSTGLHRVSGTGGEAKRIEIANEEDSNFLRWPQFLPDGRLLGVRSGIAVLLDPEDLVVQTLWDPAEPIRQARYLSSGHLVYGSAGDIIAVPFDLATLEITGPPVPAVQNVYEGNAGSAVAFAASEDGTLVFVAGGTQHLLTLVDRSGRSRTLAPERGAFRHPRFSPNGQRVAVTIDDDPRDSHIWIYDLRGSRERLTSEYHNLFPIWMPDGSAIAFSSYERGIPGGGPYLQSLIGTTNVRPLLPEEFVTPNNQLPNAWFPDGRLLVFSETHPVRGYDLWVLDLSVEKAEVGELVVTPFNEYDASVSSDGRWLAYTSDRTGRDQIYVRPALGKGEAVAISVDGGTEPRWASQTGELFFRNGDRMMVVDVQAQGEFLTSEPRVLFEANYNAFDMRNYDVSPDGQQFVMIQTDPQGDGRRFEVILNWFEELKRLVPTN